MRTQEFNYRYPGIRAFETEEKKLFFGRKDEIRKLYSLVKSKSLVVVFAKSGTGKSSLINAGIIPLLEKKQFFPIKIRFQDTDIPPVLAVKQAIKPYINNQQLSRQSKTFDNASLWECIRACQFGEEELPITPIFIFDQFEEFFDHSVENQNVLTLEIADLISERLPIKVQEEFRSIPRAQRTEEQKNWYRTIDIKFIFAIRSDRIHQLDELSEDIPIILHERFHLKPMKHEQAREAIIAPAQLLDDNFETPPFRYSESTLEKILQFLSNKNQEVESFQLQLICRNIEKNIKDQDYG